MDSKSALLKAALSGFVAGAVLTGCTTTSPTTSDANETGACFGVNGCKGKGSCAGEGHGCAGKNSCKGKGFVKMTEKDCKEKGGTFKK